MCYLRNNGAFSAGNQFRNSGSNATRRAWFAGRLSWAVTRPVRPGPGTGSGYCASRPPGPRTILHGPRRQGRPMARISGQLLMKAIPTQCRRCHGEVVSGHASPAPPFRCAIRGDGLPCVAGPCLGDRHFVRRTGLVGPTGYSDRGKWAAHEGCPPNGPRPWTWAPVPRRS